ncbi:MAG: hypothetical protein ABIV47_20550 [Roseiflexaceae bacterium]
MTRIRTFLLLGALLLVSYAYVLPRWADWSQNSRLDLVRALSEQHDVVIDDYVSNTGDYALYRGHAYSDKAPGPAFLALPAALALQPALDHPASQRQLEQIAGSGSLSATLNPTGTGINTDKLRAFVLLVAITFFASALPTALGALALYALLRRHRVAATLATLVTLAYGLATPLAAYGGNFYSHALVASLLIGAWAVTDREYTPARAVLAGLLLGWAVISEYPAALPGAIIALAGLWRWRRPSALVWLTLGGLPTVLLLVLYDWRAFGTPFPIGYEHSALWQKEHQTGFMSITYPHAAAFWGLLFGQYRGLFARAPWLLLALPGYLIWWRSGRAREHWWVALLAPLSILLFYGSSAMWPGGFAAGPRYLVLIVPFLACACVPTALTLWRRMAGRIALFVLIAVSLIVTWSEAVARQAFPPDTIANPWIEYTWPAWRDADIARNLGTFLGLRGGLSLLPLVLLIIVIGAYLLRRPTHAAAATSPTAHSTEGQTVAPIQH